MLEEKISKVNDPLHKKHHITVLSVWPEQ